ncbi:MAG: SDR family oxidoreductase, partial [Desulfobacteraceae bacterium]|nr:SDR family oxidoreductase [Desulfobacteraceae bacterium]
GPKEGDVTEQDQAKLDQDYQMHQENLQDKQVQRQWDIEKYYKDRISLHRVGEPEELAGAIAFMLSNDASYITSAALLVDAGFIVNAEL